MNNEKKRRFRALQRHSVYDGQVSAALVGAIIGMLVGTIPATIWSLIFKSAAEPLYVIPPLAIYCFIRIFRGCRDVRALIIMAALSIIGAYLTSVSVEAAIYARSYGMPVLSVPLVTILSIGDLELLPRTASGYVFPLVFTTLGYVLSCELLLSGDMETM